MDNRTRSKLQFLASIKSSYPDLYRAAVKKGGQLSGLGITQAEMLAEQDTFAEPVNVSAPWYQNMIDSAIETIKQLAPAYVGLQQAKTCISINADRVRQGLSPIDCASAGLAPQVAVGVSPDVKMVLWGVLGLGAIFLLMNMRKR